MSSASTMQLAFVVPSLDGPVSGGTLYNRELCAALTSSGCEVRVCSLESPELDQLVGASRRLFVDSLYLDALPELKRRAPCSVALLTHYLPSFVVLGRAARSAELSEPERRALSAADRFLVTSHFMREALGPLVAPQKPICVVTPGCFAQLSPRLPKAIGELHALLIGNLVPGKGIEPLLRSLAEQLLPADSLRLTILGSLDADVDYAERCRRLIAETPALTSRVILRGAQSTERVAHELAQAEVLLSASLMESYGMALAEARAAGVPILARAGGNVAQHVETSAGGELAYSTSELAAACLELARTPARVRERLRAAREHAPLARAWSRAASELLIQLESLEK